MAPPFFPHHRRWWPTSAVRWGSHLAGLVLLVGLTKPLHSAVAEPPETPLSPSSSALSAEPFPWTPVTVEGRDYVQASEVAAFYQFDRREEEGSVTRFHSATLAMKWEVDSSLLTINDTRFLLTTPCLKRDGEVLVARVDLVKWIDPLLRPSYLPAIEWFDTVVIDPGHGGLDTGTHGSFGDEKTYTLDLAQRLKAALQKHGLKVVMTRETDVRVDNQIRGLLASEVSNSVLVSLHFNQEDTLTVRGLETYAMTPMGLMSSNDSRVGAEASLGFQGNLRDNASLALAAAVHSQILHRAQCEDRGVRRARFAVLRGSERAGILLEAGYLSHPEEGALINQPEYRDRLAVAIAQGVLHYRRAIDSAR